MTDRPQSMVETPLDQDIHQLLVPTPTNEVPRPRDSSSNSSDAGSFFVPEPLSRSNSVYSFSRASLSSQLSSLTSMSLPQAESLAASITALPTAKKAVRALNNASEQIMSWTKKALKVLKNLDADDDVEWAAAAGREALEDTDKTIYKFENLISVYVVSIEELQARGDIGDLGHEQLSTVVEQMEITLDSWETVRSNLARIHEQVELAMEWEELWNTVLADVAMEMDSLSQLVFEMEEKRHKAYITQTPPETSQNFDLKELENMMGGPPAVKKRESVNPRFSMSFEAPPLDSPPIENSQDDTDLLALFARMQPLRASLDFLPMRLSVWQGRADEVFPSACNELDEKIKRVERDWQRLSEDAETLRRELSEDRWVVVFRNAGRQAQKMLESVERSVIKVQEAFDEGYQRTNPPALNKRVESLEAKKLHYMPAVQRVLIIIQKGLKDRLTVNGEILRLHRDLSTKMREMEDKMNALASMHEAATSRNRMRESMSSIMSADRSISSGTIAGTPGSSPASSIDLNTPQKMARPMSKYGLNGYSKPRAVSSSRPPPATSSNRRTSLQVLRPTTPSGLRRGTSPGPPSVYRQGVYRPTTIPTPQRQSAPPPATEKPRFSAVISKVEADKASGYVRPASTTPLSTRYAPRQFAMSTTAIPFRSPLGREAMSSPIPSTTLRSRDSMQLRSFAERVASPLPGASSLMGPVPYHKSRNISTPNVATIRSPSSLGMRSNRQSLLPSSTAIPIRPSSSLARSIGPNRSAGIPIRTGAETPNPKNHTPRSSLDSGRSVATSGPGQTDYYGSSINENDIDEEEDDISTEHGSHGSSPLTHKMAMVRPSSSLAGGVPGKRLSLLPVPVGGRLSSLGHRQD